MKQFKYIEDKDDYIIGIELENGVRITHYHEQDCCENVYADWEYLEDTDISSLLSDGLIELEIVKGSGFRLNGIFIPAYNRQNGYYSDELDIIVDYKLFETRKNISRDGGIQDDII